jgi:pilus assembly protein CpaE
MLLSNETPFEYSPPALDAASMPDCVTEGKVITVLSSGGGCGATTIAVNLAWEIQIASRLADIGSMMIVDFDHRYGAIGTYLGIDAEYGAFDLFDRCGVIELQFIHNSFVTRIGQPTVLLSTARREMGQDFADPDPCHIGQLLNHCRRSKSWTIIDAARVSTRTACELARHSDFTLVVTRLMINDIRIAQQLIRLLSGDGRPPVELVINQYRKRNAPIDLESVRDAMGNDISASITTLSECDSVSDAVNLGRALSDYAPRSMFRRDLQKFAERIAVNAAASATANLPVGAHSRGTHA